MNKKKVKIIVAGQTATGKSTLALAIINALTEYGIEIDYKSEDYKSIEHLHNSMEHDITIAQRMDFLKEKIVVEVEEVSVKSEPTLQNVNDVLTQKKIKQ